MISIGGLASGLDTGAIIDQLVALEKAPARSLTSRKYNITRHKTVVDDLSSKLKSLGDKLKSLSTPSDIRSLSGSSTDDSRVGVAVSGTAQPGSYQIRVASLARAQTNVSKLLPSAGAGAIGDGSMTISVGAGDPVSVAYTSADSLDAIASRINGSGAGINASVINEGGGYRLMVTGKEGGTGSTLSFSDTGDGFQLNDTIKITPESAVFDVNGVTVTRNSNTISDALTGVTFNLKQAHNVGDPTTVVDVSSDKAALEAKAKGFVDSFNSVIDVLDSQLRYTGTPKGGDTLFGDSTLRGLQSKLSSMVTTSYSNGAGTTSLGEVGIKLDNAGRLSIDSAKLAAAVAADPTIVENLFTATDGVAATFQTTIGAYTQAGDGILSAKNTEIDKRIRAFDDQIARIEDSATQLGDRLNLQFSALERAMIDMQGQMSYINALFYR